MDRLFRVNNATEVAEIIDGEAVITAKPGGDA
jgi:hypothetical protein